MLRKIRVILSVILFALITFYFLDFAGVLPLQFHALAHLQLIPALFSLSIGILAFWVIATLLLGRVYCSTICPMGVYQDVVRRFSLFFRNKKQRRRKSYFYAPAKNVLRWSVVVLAGVAFACGFTVVIALLDPYSAYGRMSVNLFKPIYMLGNNVLESLFARFDNYAFYQVEVSLLDVSSFVLALTTALVIGYLAARHGRTWCNTLCPVGTVLGFLSKFSYFKIRFDESKCNKCGVCATKCKASCINSSEQTVDSSRCVGCFNCLDACNKKALVYKPSRKGDKQEADASKRRFLATGLMTAAVAPRVMAQTQKAIAVLGGKKAFETENAITPPGSISREHFQRQCTSCHLCVSKCPSHVLKPAFMEYGLGGIMQPTVHFDKGFCNFDCTVCGDVCPNGAIRPLTVQQKHLTQIGYVVFIEENCIVYTDGTSCGACSEHCPTQAIAMVPYKGGLTIPQVNIDICVGCGGCEYVCPARPFRAVHIEGNLEQKQANPFTEKHEETGEIDGFGF